MRTSLQGIANKAQRDSTYRFRNLYTMLNDGFLRDSWEYLKKDAASGVDHVSAAEYEQNFDENISNLVERLKRKRYRAKLVKPRIVESRRPWKAYARS